ncbi:MAG TPA: CPBP family intramembrane glutamic endopeptidase [Phenylobacterium sp.]|uniref:CPBP family intramembrane glutamic endopeptidase n=1 Tax=Phenylobacterium sp. TaxID=1871053 RepID=UPI002D49E41C|nr:CPBP family intramembrane glutamic endopeptidase [Phenylobacterium sp.]HZZ69739.1 CPBP family intramembrane glutamic endopeptidase [Phenylobacterium sp.]
MIDLVLTAYLVALLPAYQLWRSLRKSNAPTTGRMARYLRTLAIATVPTAGVLAVWILEGRSWIALGLGLPIGGLAGLGVVVLALPVMGVGMRPKAMAGKTPPTAVTDMLPTTPGERLAFIVSTVVSCAAWELLYRGYLLWVLSPRIGVPLAVIAAATAYGVAHGFKDARQLLGSLASALVFTTAYAVSHSLWWLMLFHAGLPMLMLMAAPTRSGPAAAASVAAP